MTEREEIERLAKEAMEKAEQEAEGRNQRKWAKQYQKNKRLLEAINARDSN